MEGNKPVFRRIKGHVVAIGSDKRTHGTLAYGGAGAVGWYGGKYVAATSLSAEHALNSASSMFNAASRARKMADNPKTAKGVKKVLIGVANDYASKFKQEMRASRTFTIKGAQARAGGAAAIGTLVGYGTNKFLPKDMKGKTEVSAAVGVGSSLAGLYLMDTSAHYHMAPKSVKNRMGQAAVRSSHDFYPRIKAFVSLVRKIKK